MISWQKIDKVVGVANNSAFFFFVLNYFIFLGKGN